MAEVAALDGVDGVSVRIALCVVADDALLDRTQLHQAAAGDGGRHLHENACVCFDHFRVLLDLRVVHKHLSDVVQRLQISFGFCLECFHARLDFRPDSAIVAVDVVAIERIGVLRKKKLLNMDNIIFRSYLSKLFIFNGIILKLMRSLIVKKSCRVV